MKKLKQIMAQAVLFAFVFTAVFQQSRFSTFAEEAAFLTASPDAKTKASASIVYRDMKSHYAEWYKQNDNKIDPSKEFWEMLSAYELENAPYTGEDYSKVDYEKLSAVELSEYIIAMVIDGKNPNTIKVGNATAVAYLASMEQADGSFKSSLSTDYGTSYYDQDLPLFALYICGKDITAKQIGYYESFVVEGGGIGMDWGYGGDPTDPMATGQALILSDLSGINFNGKESCAAYMNALGETIVTNSNNMSWYISWKVEQGKKDVMTEEIALFMQKGLSADTGWGASPYGYDFDQKTFLGYSNEGANKDCARAIAEYQRGQSFLTSLKARYQGIIAPKSDDSGSGTSTESKPAKTGTWNDPVTDGTWTQAADGSWNYKTNAQFKSTWGYILNPFAKGTQKNFWFYFDASGKMLTGWQKINGKWYFLNNAIGSGELGACLLNTVTPDGYTVNENGEWTVNGVVQLTETAAASGGSSTFASQTVKESGSTSGSGSSGTSSGTGEEYSLEEQPKSFTVSVSISANVTTESKELKKLSGSKTITVEEDCGYTAYDALCELCDDLEYEIEGDGDYVSSIGGLAEFEGGVMSGWMYSINGKYPNVCCGNYEVRKGDRISWVYVTSMRETTDV